MGGWVCPDGGRLWGELPWSCAHHAFPFCHHAFARPCPPPQPARMGVAPCPACEGEAAGTLVLDPVSAPAWRLDCSRCSFLICEWRLPALLKSFWCAGLLVVLPFASALGTAQPQHIGHWSAWPLLRHQHTEPALLNQRLFCRRPAQEPALRQAGARRLRGAGSAPQTEGSLTSAWPATLREQGLRQPPAGGRGSPLMCRPSAPVQECGSTLLALDWKKGQSPLAGGDTQHTGGWRASQGRAGCLVPTLEPLFST